jgi:hypothetical protein
MTPEISSVTGLRSGIAAFMRGDTFSHGWSALRDPAGVRFRRDAAAGRGSGRPERLRGAAAFLGRTGGVVGGHSGQRIIS